MQHSIRQVVEISGFGLHSGASVRVWLVPAPANAGISWYRIDRRGMRPIPLCSTAIDPHDLQTVVGQNGHGVATVEHALSAINMCGIDNLAIYCDGPELPVLDGSALPWVNALRANTFPQGVPRRLARVRRFVTVSRGWRWVRFEPPHNNAATFDIAYCFPWGGRYRLHFNSIDVKGYMSFVAPTTTFCLSTHVKRLLDAGLGQGAAFDTMHIVDGTCESTVAMDCVRHKLLDAIGDVMLGGIRVMGHYRSESGGHWLNGMLMRKLFSSAQNYEIVCDGGSV